jgi:periplasmic protein TonB
MGVYTTQSNWLSRRGIFLLLLVLFHVVLIWGLKSGFAMKLVAAITPPIVADIINEPKDEKAPPPPPPPKLELPPVEVPPPVVDIQITPDAPPSTAIQNVTDRPAPPPPPPAAPPPPKLNLSKSASQPNFDDYYPPTSIRLGEEGLVKVKICVAPNGKVATSELGETSGFERLDEAGVKMAKMYRFNPVSAQVCTTLPVRFKIKAQ